MATGFSPEFATIQQGYGVPSHQANVGTLYFDVSGGVLFRNTTGGTAWCVCAAGGQGACETLAAARTLTIADSGKTFFLALAGGFTVTLPANALGAGFTARFVATVSPTTAYIILAATADTIVGWPLNCGGADSVADGNALGDQINFAANVALAGDQVDIIGDGTLWYARANAKAINAITITG